MILQRETVSGNAVKIQQVETRTDFQIVKVASNNLLPLFSSVDRSGERGRSSSVATAVDCDSKRFYSAERKE